MNKKCINSALSCEAYFSFVDGSCDHRIVTVKIRLSLRRNATQRTKTAFYHWSLLNNRDINHKYIITLRNNFDALMEISETLRMINMRTSSMPTWKQHQNAYQPKRKTKSFLRDICNSEKNVTTWKQHLKGIKRTKLMPIVRNLRRHKVNKIAYNSNNKHISFKIR